MDATTEPTKEHGKNTVLQTLTASFRARPRRGEAAILDVVAAAAAFLFAGAEVVFGVRPLAVALLSAVSGHALAVYIGASLGCLPLGAPGVVYFLICTLTFGLRLLLSYPGKRRHLPACEGVFCELPQLRVSVACVSGLALGVYELCVAGVRSYTLLFALGALLLPPLFAFFYAGVFTPGFSLHEFLLSPSVEAVKSRISQLWEQAGMLALLFSGTFSLVPYSLFGISAAELFAAAAALLAARRFGALEGAAAGFVAALPASAVMAPAYGFVGFFAGLLRKKGMFWPMVTAVAAGSIWCAYVGGLEGFLGNMPEIAATTLIVYPLTFRVPAVKAAQKQKTALAEAPLPPSGERLAAAFASLSRVMYREAEAGKTPDFGDYAALCRRVCDARCRECEKRGTCWEGEDKPAETAMREAAALFARGETEKPPSAAGMRAVCPDAGAILDDARRAAILLREGKRSVGARETSAFDFDVVSRLLDENAAHDRAEQREDTALGAELKAALSEIGITVGNITVQGERHRRVTAGGLRWDGQTLPAEKLHAELERLCGCALSYPGFEMHDGFVTLQMQSVRRYAAHVATAAAGSENGEASGDSTAAFENRDDYFYALLCDGMGSGERAQHTSSLGVEILREMLTAGNNEDTSLKMLNGLLRAGDGECSTTVDLLEIDLLYGKASFVKSGAAASYVKRGENLFRIRSETSPVGILRTIDAERIHFAVRPGDVIILLSDGISQSMEDAPWLLEYLASLWVESLEDAAAHILSLARSHGSRDDMTVMLVQMEPYREQAESAEKEAKAS